MFQSNVTDIFSDACIVTQTDVYMQKKTVYTCLESGSDCHVRRFLSLHTTRMGLLLAVYIQVECQVKITEWWCIGCI